MTATDLFEVKRIIAEAYSTRPDRHPITADSVPEDSLLFDYENAGAVSLELDSLDALEIAACLEERFDVVFPSDLNPARIATPARIVEYVHELLSAQKPE